jgi:hypothetical protein
MNTAVKIVGKHALGGKAKRNPHSDVSAHPPTDNPSHHSHPY